ncbi:E2 ligase fold family C protein [Micromonospora aurantiaca (nom. illeg.)]
MALADYFNRAALAASQVIAGFDELSFRSALEHTDVGISFDRATTQTHEGQALLDLTVRLLARLYPTITLRPAPGVEAAAQKVASIAKAINPNITIADNASLGIAIGPEASSFDRTVFAGSDAWTGRLSSETPQAIGGSSIPLGAGVAACLAAATVFRAALLNDTSWPLADTTFSCLHGVEPIPSPDIPAAGLDLPNPTVLVGCGAIGQAAVWALARSPLRGELFLVDHEKVELSNMQRYVLTTRRDDRAEKTSLAAAAISNGLKPREHQGDWASFVNAFGYRLTTVLTALDSAADRRAVQAALPRWIANAWTQPGDLGVSAHSFETGACLACIYLPAGEGSNEDVVVATALGIPSLVPDVRTLLYTGAPVPSGLLDAVSAGLRVPREHLAPFEGQPIRKLYVEGICGGAVIPLGMAGTPRQEVHVPLAHQSALAGVLLAARLVRMAAGADPGTTEVTRLNVLRSPSEQPTQPALKDPRGICICTDPDYQAVYAKKWRTAEG